MVQKIGHRTGVSFNGDAQCSQSIPNKAINLTDIEAVQSGGAVLGEEKAFSRKEKAVFLNKITIREATALPKISGSTVAQC